MNADTIGDDDTPLRAVGLMSGTSVDGVDGVLLRLGGGGDGGAGGGIAIEASAHFPFPPAMQAEIGRLIESGHTELDQLGWLHSQLGYWYAQAAKQLITDAGSPTVAVIGCHGQTIRHRPGGDGGGGGGGDDSGGRDQIAGAVVGGGGGGDDGGGGGGDGDGGGGGNDETNHPPFTLQLGNAALVAHLTGIPVVADFRSADVAAGGQGAPLAPAFHHAAWADPARHLAIINLGGIANITHLPAGGAVTGFDTGPANTLLDAWCRRHANAPHDHNGDHAAAGTVQPELLTRLLADPYFTRPPPKSTGREYFNEAWLERVIGGATTTGATIATPPPLDMLATLTALTAESIARQLNRLHPPPQAAYACGGGVHNATLMRMLAERCHAKVATTAALGIAPQWVEAAAFAWLAAQTLRRIPATLPSVTGATKPTIAGAIYYPAAG